MPAEVETNRGFLAEKPAWWGGEDLVHHGKIYAEEALKLSKMDYPVELAPAYLLVDGEYIPVDGDFGTLRRLPNGGVEGFKTGLSGGYTIVQTADAFKLIDDLVDSDQVQIETVLSLRGGRKIVVTARIPEHVRIAGERTDTYIVFVTTHDGTGATRVFTTNVRVVCANTLALALMGAQRVYSVRHTRNALERLQQARESLEMTFAYTKELKTLGENLAMEPLSDREWFKLMDELWPLPEDEKKGRTRTIREGVREDVSGIYFREENLNNIRRTRWGALNAVIQWNDFDKKYRNPDGKIEDLIGGSDLPNRALAVLGSM